MTRLLRHLPRWLNRLYAKAIDYGWISCPICKRSPKDLDLATELARTRLVILRSFIRGIDS